MGEHGMASAPSLEGATLLTPRQRREAAAHLHAVQECSSWHGGLPVLVLDRCWLRLTCLAVEDLARRVPPDASREAPELGRYRELLAMGHPAWQAQLLCWDEFGSQECQEALRRYWDSRERGNQGWTLQHYLDLLRDYRRSFEGPRPRPLPLLVLARASRQGAIDSHRLLWLWPDGSDPSRPMRHTCA
jgi:hypothetical protein